MSDEDINEERVRQEAQRHQGQVKDPGKPAAERRHSAARYRVLPREEEQGRAKDPDEIERELKQAEAEAARKVTETEDDEAPRR